MNDTSPTISAEKKIADYICEQLAEVLIERDNKLNGTLEDILKSQKTIQDKMEEISILVTKHDAAIVKLERYASIENTIIRISIAVLLAIGVIIVIHKYLI